MAILQPSEIGSHLLSDFPQGNGVASKPHTITFTIKCYQGYVATLSLLFPWLIQRVERPGSPCKSGVFLFKTAVTTSGEAYGKGYKASNLRV